MTVQVSAAAAALIRLTGDPAAAALRPDFVNPAHILAGVRSISAGLAQKGKPGLVGDLVRRSSHLAERGGHLIARVAEEPLEPILVASLADLEEWICSLPPGSVTLGESGVFSPALELRLAPAYLARLIEDGVIPEEKGVQE